jgi:uncharacterized membrane protein YebE (DUF533 family)
MERKLGRDVFLALAAVGWADGALDDDEADAIVRTAADEGLDIDEIAEIEEAVKTPLSVGQIDISRLTKADRLFVYAVGAWIARVDGQIAPAEITALNQLAQALKIPDKPREQADAIALEVAGLAGGNKPAFFNLSKLRRTLMSRLEEAQRMRTSSRQE